MTHNNDDDKDTIAAGAPPKDRDQQLDESERQVADRMKALRDRARSIQRRFSPPGGMPAVRLPSPSHPDGDR